MTEQKTINYPIDFLRLWLQYKNGKITLKEFEEKTSATQYLNIDWNKEKIKGTIYFEEIKKVDKKEGNL